MTVDSVKEPFMGNNDRKESVSRKICAIIIVMLLIALAIMVWCIHVTMQTPSQPRLRRNRDSVATTTFQHYGSYGSHILGTTTSAPTLAPADDTLGQFLIGILLFFAVLICLLKVVETWHRHRHRQW